MATLIDDVGSCPRCEELTMMTPLEINALSRTTREVNDTPMWVCSDCGMDEGLEDAFSSGATPQSEWPMKERRFEYFIGQTIIQNARLMNEKEENEGR